MATNIHSSKISPQALIICPHFDDACLSLGGLLSKRLFKSVALLTVFSNSEHAPALKLLTPFLMANQLRVNPFRGITKSFVSSIRQREDAKFCSAIGANQYNLPFNDSSLRGYSNPNCGDWNNIERESVYGEVMTAIERIVLLCSWDILFCPLGIGNHVDHLIVTNSFLKAMKKNKCTHAFFYEDLPYASNCSLDTIAALVSSRIGPSYPLFIDISANLHEKQKLVSLYKSQDIKKMKKAISLHAQRLYETKNKNQNNKCLHFERIWTLRTHFNFKIPEKKDSGNPSRTNTLWLQTEIKKSRMK